jgi:hypothetical protein
MKKKTNNPTRSKFTILHQICNLIPAHLVPELARRTGAQDKARSFTPWSHVVSMLFGQLAHSFGLNDLCDCLQLHSGELSKMRGAQSPSRNGLSHANRHRPAQMAEELFWAVKAHLGQQSPGFITGQRRGPAFRFKMPIHIVDATVMELVANCMDWAKHRRRKAAVKTHLRLNFQSLLPGFVRIDTAAQHEVRRARELCAGIQSGQIALFDKGYVDFEHLEDLDQRGVFWVTRAKDNLAYKVVEKRSCCKDPKILKDEIIVLRNAQLPAPKLMRRVEALVELDAKERPMVFLTNNLDWSPLSVADLYRCRWEIEVFFKQLKQDLQLADFLGYSANAVRWQVWMALLVYLLLRYLAFVSQWCQRFTRLLTVLRGVLWSRLGLADLLQCYGTARVRPRSLAQPEQAYFAGFV